LGDVYLGWAMFIWDWYHHSCSIVCFTKQFESLLLALTAIEHQYGNLPIHQKLLN
jgi:hypothetical protein